MGQDFTVIKFDPLHLALIQAREFEAREMELCEDIQARGRLYQEAGPAFTGMVGEEIMFCCGLIKLWPGVYELWAVTTPLVACLPLTFHRAIKYGFGKLRTVTGLWRVQTAIHVDHLVSQKWIQKLGLRFEGERPGYGPDKATYFGYGRFYG